jgi:hypothetical protein
MKGWYLVPHGPGEGHVVAVTRFRIEAQGDDGRWTTVGTPGWTHSGGLQFFSNVKRIGSVSR